LVSITDPLSIVQSLTYDPVGNIITDTDGNGETTTYTYDGLDSLINTTYYDSTDVDYTYDPVGNRLSMTDSYGTTAYTYDDLYRPVSVTSPEGSLTYTYDAVNRLSLTTPSGTTTYAYSAANQLTQVSDWASNTAQYTYDNAGRLSTTTLPNGVVTTNTYDNADRLTSVVHKLGTTVLESFTYTLDAVGNRLSMADADGTTSYTYDALDRITSVTYPTGTPTSVSYTYDAMGNRLSMTQDGVSTSYTYDAADRLLSKTTGTETTHYTWDNDGNMLTKGPQTFTWNPAGKLETWTDGSNSASYQYNGDGVRVSYTVNEVATTYLQDLATGMAVVLSENTGSQTTLYVYGNDLISQSTSSGAVYLLADGLGSTRLLTDETGSVVGRYVYDVFGMERTKTGTGETDFTFAGEQMDPETGLQYLRERYYDPGDGRFISEDPFQSISSFTQSQNKYIYSFNNPILLFDPTGEFAVAGAIIVVLFVGTVYVGAEKLYEHAEKWAEDRGKGIGWSKEDILFDENESKERKEAIERFDEDHKAIVKDVLDLSRTPGTSLNPNLPNPFANFDIYTTIGLAQKWLTKIYFEIISGTAHLSPSTSGLNRNSSGAAYLNQFPSGFDHGSSGGGGGGGGGGGWGDPISSRK
jgi:RHS repeat-associated protein